MSCLLLLLLLLNVVIVVVCVVQTGSESSVDRLMKQITSFMSEIPDEFKVVVVQAIR